jgi:hypothetical protein
MNNDIENGEIVLTESFRYDPQTEMVACLGCDRLNPPDRAICLYCGKDLPVTEMAANVAPKHLRRAESWENGFNVIFNSVTEGAGKLDAGKLAEALSFEPADVMKIIEAGAPFPLLRAATEAEALRLSNYLLSYGLACVIVRDETLAVNTPPRRVRCVDFFEDWIGLTLFNTGEVVEAKRNDIGIFVTGAVIETKTETSEKRKRGKSEITDKVEMRADETVIDLYLRGDAIGYRIMASGFDFSGLGVQKTMIGQQNMTRLARMLAEFAPDARWIDYLPNAKILDSVWELDERVASNGMKRTGFGKVEHQRTATANNLRQFTKFSRMHQQFL